METYAVELEVAEGLEFVAVDELLERYGSRLITEPQVEPGALRFGYEGNLGGLLVLQTVLAGYLVETFDIPRPKAFLGHQHLTRLLQQIETVRALTPNAYTTITINAAGSQSSVMQRLLQTLASETGLTAHPDEGDLLLRLRRAVIGNGWDALVRLSPRPNATRDWRMVNVPGALNASVAHAMARLSEPTDTDVVLNVACGSGTLAIERLRFGKAARVIACDVDEEALAAAQQNIAAAALADEIELRDWDATDLPLGTNTADVVFADLPFGNRVGSHQGNVRLYPKLMKEAARVTKRGGRFVLITHEVKLMDAVLQDSGKWEAHQQHRVLLSGLHPRIYVLLRI